MALLKNQKQLAKFDYDFAVDGGGVGSIALRPDITALKEGMIITDMYIHFEAALTSGGSATVTIGNTDADGFFADVFALGTLNGVVRVGEVAGALVWDDTNDHMIPYRVSSDLDLDVNIGTAALTAGKFSVYVEFFAP